jgi:hypothetical protein
MNEGSMRFGDEESGFVVEVLGYGLRFSMCGYVGGI